MELWGCLSSGLCLVICYFYFYSNSTLCWKEESKLLIRGGRKLQKEALSKGFIYLLLIIGSLLMLLPFVWMISTSLKVANEVMIMPPKWIPSDIQWGNYIKAWFSAPFANYTVNSVIVLVASTIGE